MSDPDESGTRDKAFANFASGLEKVQEDDKKAKKEILKAGIERIEKENIDQIHSSRLLTSKLTELRESADLSPFIGTSGKITSPKFKRGEFIQVLAREVLYIGREEMKEKGGIMSLHGLREYFKTNRDNWELRDNDIPEALTWLDEQELIPELQTLENEEVLIFFRPIELSEDPKLVLMAATGIEATKTSLKTLLGWNDERLTSALLQLERDGIAIISGEEIFFPGM